MIFTEYKIYVFMVYTFYLNWKVQDNVLHFDNGLFIKTKLYI